MGYFQMVLIEIYLLADKIYVGINKFLYKLPTLNAGHKSFKERYATGEAEEIESQNRINQFQIDWDNEVKNIENQFQELIKTHADLDPKNFGIPAYVRPLAFFYAEDFLHMMVKRYCRHHFKTALETYRLTDDGSILVNNLNKIPSDAVYNEVSSATYNAVGADGVPLNEMDVEYMINWLRAAQDKNVSLRS